MDLSCWRIFFGAVTLWVSALGYGCALHFAGGRVDTVDLYTARSFLIGSEAEQSDYGLYSYLLFPAPPTPETIGRYEAAVRAFLVHPPAPSAEELLPHENLNIFYLFLINKPQPEVERCLLSNCYPIEDDVVTSILANYNYTRAQIVLRQITPEHRNGPYIATRTQPVSITPKRDTEKPSPKALYQNLSNAPPHLVHSWVELFIEKATGEGSAFQRNLNTLMLTLREGMEGYAQGLPKVFNACLLCLELKKRLPQ